MSNNKKTGKDLLIPSKSSYEELRHYLLEEPVIFDKYSIVYSLSFIVNCLIFPAIAFQMWKTYKRKEAGDFNPFFVLLQLLGGAPEGMVGAILGHLSGNTQMFYIGLYAMMYNAYMLFFRLFGKNGLVKPLFK